MDELVKMYEEAVKQRQHAELEFECADYRYIDVATLKLTASELKENLLRQEIKSILDIKKDCLSEKEQSFLERIYNYVTRRKEGCQT